MICPFPLTSCAVAGTKSCVSHTRTSLPHWQKRRKCILNSHSELHAALRLESFVYSWSLLLPVSPLWFSLSWTSNERRRKGFVQVTMWPLLVKVQEITPSPHPTPNYPCCVCVWVGGHEMSNTRVGVCSWPCPPCCKTRLTEDSNSTFRSFVFGRSQVQMQLQIAPSFPPHKST